MRSVWQVKTTNRDCAGFAYFSRKALATNNAHDRNRIRIERLMVEANKMTGIKRGKNVEAWAELVDKIATPFFIVKEILLDDDYY